MAEVLILFPPDKKVAAQQVAEALTEARYSARLTPLDATGGEAVLEALRGAGPSILIWSRTLAASADIDGWLRPLRQVRQLIEVSTDGIGPLGGDESRVITLSGWRGQPFHLGWQRVLAELEVSGLARGRAAVPVAESQPVVAATDANAPPAERTRPAGGSIDGRRFAVPAIGAAALLGVVGAMAWIGEKPPQVAEPARPAAAMAAAPVADPRPDSALQWPLAGAGETIAPADETPASSTPPARKATASDPPPVETSVRRAAHAERRPMVKPRALQAVPVVKRYSKKRSKIMRQFCESSGRHTLECRIFARSMAAAKR